MGAGKESVYTGLTSSRMALGNFSLFQFAS